MVLLSLLSSSVDDSAGHKFGQLCDHFVLRWPFRPCGAKKRKIFGLSRDLSTVEQPDQAAMPAEPEPRSNLVTAPLGRWTCESDPQITEWLDVLCPSLEPGRMSIYVRGREAFCDPSKAGAGARTLMVDIAEKANGQWSCGVAGGVPGISVETESVDMVRLRVDWRHARDNRVSLAGHNAEVADELPRRDKLYDLFDVCSQNQSAC